MAKLVFALNQSLDGYVDHLALRPSAALSRHFMEHVRGLTGSVYGRRVYEIMRYWENELPDWDDGDRDFAAVWGRMRKWVVSRSRPPLGPNATLLGDDLATAIGDLKAKHEGEIDVAGPNLAGSLTELGLIDEYRLYLHPVVLGRGTPFFAGPRPRLRLVGSEPIDADVFRLTYVPA